jgi:hypothetical protein
MQAVAADDAQLSQLRVHVTERDVRADLDAGLKQIVDAIEAYRR